MARWQLCRSTQHAYGYTFVYRPRSNNSRAIYTVLLTLLFDLCLLLVRMNVLTLVLVYFLPLFKQRGINSILNMLYVPESPFLPSKNLITCKILLFLQFNLFPFNVIDCRSARFHISIQSSSIKQAYKRRK